jgi:hypothetical protein
LNDILLYESRDAGRTWRNPRRVNRDARDGQVNHFCPDIAARDGELFVTFRTRDHAGTPSNLVRQRFVTSTDEGHNWSVAEPLGPPADLRYAALAPVPFLGDYQGTAASPRGFIAVWNVSSKSQSSPPYHQTTWAATISN